MTGFDFVIAGVLAASVAIGIYRGFIREAFSLVTLAAALIVAIKFSRLPTTWLSDIELGGFVLTGSDLQTGLVFVALFIAVIVAGSLIGRAVSRAARRSLVRVLDHLLGAVFGFVRGFVIVLVMVLLAGLTQLPFSEGWGASLLVPPFERSARYAMCYVPEGYRSPHYACAAVGDGEWP